MTPTAKRILILVAGWLLVAAGVVLLVLPGPGIVVILAGLGLLSRELEWARRLRDRLRAYAKQRREAFSKWREQRRPKTG